MAAVGRKEYPLRMPFSLWAQLSEAAKENARSVNAEIVYRLRDSLKPGYRV